MPQPFVIKNHVVFPIKTTRPSLPGYLLGGWGYRKLVRVAAFTVPEDLSNVTALLDVTDPDLRSVANGGKVQSPTGDDIALATVGDKPHTLSYERRLYDPTVGRLIAFVLLPQVLYAADTGVYVYFGADVADQNDPAGAWSAWESAFTGSSGAGFLDDVTGYHRHAKITGSIAHTGGPNDALDGLSITGSLRLPDVASRRRAVVSFWFRHGAIAGTGYETVYSHTRAGVAGIDIAFRRTGSGGNQVRLVLFDANASITSDHGASIDDGDWHLLHLAWDDNDGVKLYIDGVLTGTAATLNTRCEPGIAATVAYTGEIALIRTAWRPFSTADAVGDFLSQSNSLFTLVSGVETVPAITMVNETANQLPFSFTDDLVGLPVTIDYNVYIQAETAPIAHLDAYPALDCVDNALLDKACWQVAFPAFDVHSKWYATNANLDKYQDPVNYRQQLSINTKLAVRLWHCDAPTVAYPSCDDTEERFIQYLGSSDGSAGFFGPVTFTAPDANFTTDDYRAVVGSDGFLSAIPTTAP